MLMMAPLRNESRNGFLRERGPPSRAQSKMRNEVPPALILRTCYFHLCST